MKVLMASDVLINNLVAVDRIIRVKAQEKEIKMVFDIEQGEFSEKEKAGKLFWNKWKENYLKNWCLLEYRLCFSEKEMIK